MRASKRIWTPIVLSSLWAAILVALMILRPRPYSGLFWTLLGLAFVTGGGSILLSRAQNRHAQRKYTDWHIRLKSLVDCGEIEDDGHLHEDFDDDEWNQIFSELAKMPKGARSLRRAIEVVDPEYLKVQKS